MVTQVLERGNADPTVADAYANTVASYGGSSPSIGNNILVNVPCNISVFVGAVVRMNISTAINAQANNKANSEVIGICISKSSGTTCDIQVSGYTPDIYTGLGTANTYYLSDSSAGALTTTAPTTSGSYVLKIGKTSNTTNIVIQYSRIVKRG